MSTTSRGSSIDGPEPENPEGTMSNGTVTDFEVGAVLGRGLNILASNLVSFGLLSMILMSPPYLLVLAFGMDFTAIGPNLAVAAVAIIMIVILLYFLLSGALIYGTIPRIGQKYDFD